MGLRSTYRRCRFWQKRIIFSIFPSVVQAYTQSYSFGGRIKLFICQIKYELSIIIHEMLKKTLDGGPYISLHWHRPKSLSNWTKMQVIGQECKSSTKQDTSHRPNSKQVIYQTRYKTSTRPNAKKYKSSTIDKNVSERYLILWLSSPLARFSPSSQIFIGYAPNYIENFLLLI